MQRSYLYSAASILMSFLVVTVVTAEGTPDGYPPPMEDICDTVEGAPYGLCNAYCEAMDCDSETPNASIEACENVAAKFTQITGDPLPCVVDCPCNDSSDFPEFYGFVNNEIMINECAYDSVQGNILDSLEVENNDTIAAVWITEAGLYSGCGNKSSTTNDLNEDQYYACKSLLEDAIANTANLVCNPPDSM